MGFKDYRAKTILRTLSMALTIFVFVYFWQKENSYSLTLVVLGGAIAYQVYAMTKMLENTNRELIDFLASIRYDDFSQTYNLEDKGGSFVELNREFNRVIQNFKQIRNEKEADYQYLKNIIHHVGIGILSFDNAGNVQILNTAAKKLFQVGRLRNISELHLFSGELVEQLKQMRTGSKALIRINQEGNIIQLAIYAIQLYLKGEEYKLVTVQNIQNELEEKEMEAWQNLIRVLTHEIMNSVTPISSLASTVEGELNYYKEQNQPLDEETLEDVHLAIQTIGRRSQALIRFVNDFRSLTHMPNPELTHIKVSDIFQHVKILMEQDCKTHNIRLETRLDPQSLIITADREMIEQVLINMIKNAMQALQEMSSDENHNKLILLIGKQTPETRPLISVQDNGPGIDHDAMDRIFIPFFTTKKSGSGIGLSLSRQIMRQHKGSITAYSKPGMGSTFNLIF